MPYTKAALPNFCTACGQAMDLQKDEVKEFLLRHFNVAKYYLDIILSHPDLAPYVSSGEENRKVIVLPPDHDWSKSQLWQDYVDDNY
eukprot:g75400.t1